MNTRNFFQYAIQMKNNLLNTIFPLIVIFFINSQYMFILSLLKPHLRARLGVSSKIGMHSALFSYSSGLKKILSDEEQQSYIADAALLAIRTFKQESYLSDKRSIRQRILDKDYLNRILLKVVSKDEQKFKDLQVEINQKWLKEVFQQKNYKPILAGFQINEGVRYNRSIWPQDRMFLETNNYKIVLFPTFTNAGYFSRLLQSQGVICSGTKGTGKSFSFFTFAFLSHFKVKCQLSKGIGQNTNPNKQQVIPQIFYINMQDKTDFKEYFDQIAQQITQIYPQSDIQKDVTQLLENHNTQIADSQSKTSKSLQRKKLVMLLQNLLVRAQKYNIIITCVIDEANRIFRLLRLLEKFIGQNGEKSQWKQTQQFTALTFYSQLFEVLTKGLGKFYNIIINSSQDYQINHANSQSNSTFTQIVKNSIPFLNLIFKLRNFAKKTYDTKYNNTNVTALGQIQLYNIFWFSILKFISKKQILGDEIIINSQYEKKLKIHREIFNDQFGLSKPINLDQGFKNDIVKWQNTVTYLSIRQYLDQWNITQDYFSFFSIYNNIFASQSPTQAQIIKFRQDLRKLKLKIQRYRVHQVSQMIIKYINHASTFSQGVQRSKHLQTILLQATNYCQERKNNRQKPNIEYEYLKSNKLTQLQKQTLTSTLKIGYFEDNKLIFDYCPQNLVEIMSRTFASTRYCAQIARLMKKVLLDDIQIKFNQQAGDYFDKISFPIFLQGNFKLQYVEYKFRNQIRLGFSQPQEILQSQYISQTSSFIGSKNMESKIPGIFNGLLSVLNESKNLNKIVGGYPVRVVKTNHFKRKNDKNRQQQQLLKQPSENTYFLHQKDNMCFDNLTIRKLNNIGDIQKKICYEIRFYDWTMGRPGSKSGKNFLKQIKYYLEQSGIQGDINCKLLIVSPDFYADQYLNWWRKQVQRKNVRKDSLPDLFLSESYETTINGIAYKRDISVGLASFNKSTPFHPTSVNTILKEIASQCYKEVKKRQNQMKYHANKS